MGAWSGEPFGNDTAADWAWTLDDASDWSPVLDAFDAVLAGGYVEDDDATVAIAAAEVVAHGLGRGTQDDSYTDSVRRFTARVSPPVPDLVERARAALAASTGEGSGLRELWDEADDDSWAAANGRLAAALE